MPPDGSVGWRDLALLIGHELVRHDVEVVPGHQVVLTYDFVVADLPAAARRVAFDDTRPSLVVVGPMHTDASADEAAGCGGERHVGLSWPVGVIRGQTDRQLLDKDAAAHAGANCTITTYPQHTPNFGTCVQ